MLYNSFIRTIILLLPSVAAALIDSIIHEKLHSKKQSRQNKDSDSFDIILLHLLISILVYIVLSVVAVAVYAFWRSRHGLSNFDAICDNLIGYYIKAHLGEFFLAPTLVYIATQVVRLKQGTRIIVSILLVVTLIFSPFIISFEAPNKFPMETEILTELRSKNVPYEGRFFDITHFRQRIEDGYWIGERANPEPEMDYENADYEYYFEDNPSSLDEYVDNCVYFRDKYDSENARFWLDKAYEFYLSGGESSLNAVGRMWFYKGEYENSDYYITAAETFANNGEYYNVALSYENAYEQNSQEDSFALLSLEYYIKAVSIDDSPLKSLESFKTVICSFGASNMMSPDYYIKYVRDMHKIVPKDIFLSVLILNDDYAKGNYQYSDKELTDGILAKEEYANCPKLMILHTLCEEEIDSSCESIYELLLTHEDFFEPEDKINLAWLLYQTGEYVKAYQIAAGMYDCIDETESIVLLRAESFLQNEVALSETDKETLYRDVSETIEQEDISIECLQRLKLVQCILAGKLGLDPNFTNLSEICTDLFGEQSITGMYIVASLDCREGLYSDTIELCNKILERIDSPNYFYNSVLFLKSDALMSCAKNVSREERQFYYEEAERILNTVKENIGNDYITCLQKLNELYKVMDNRDQELQEITEMLMHLQ